MAVHTARSGLSWRYTCATLVQHCAHSACSPLDADNVISVSAQMALVDSLLALPLRVQCAYDGGAQTQPAGAAHSELLNYVQARSECSQSLSQMADEQQASSDGGLRAADKGSAMLWARTQDAPFPAPAPDHHLKQLQAQYLEPSLEALLGDVSVCGEAGAQLQPRHARASERTLVCVPHLPRLHRQINQHITRYARSTAQGHSRVLMGCAAPWALRAQAISSSRPSCPTA